MSTDLEDYRIWKSDILQTDRGRWGVFDSPRIDGTYRISLNDARNLKYECELLEQMSGESVDRIKARLGTELIDAISYGEVQPSVTQSTIYELLDESRPLTVSKRVRRLLKLMTRPEVPINEPFRIVPSNPLYETALGWSESTKYAELASFLTHLASEDLITIQSVPGTWIYREREGEGI